MTRTLGFIIYPDFQILDAAGPIAAFEIAGRIRSGAYDIRVMAETPGRIASSSGVGMWAEPLSGEPLDTLIAIGGDGAQQAILSDGLLEWLRAAAPGARRIASVCSGTYLLAQAGLLDGRRATTHWHRSKHFARMYPDVKLEPDRIFVRDGNIWSSAGITAGIDLSLALIGEDLGERVARRTAQQLVVYHRRPGGQSQFSALVEMGGEQGRFADLVDWIRERLADRLTVERLAERAGMSARNFARAFAAETGMTPAKAVERLRLETARSRIEDTSDQLDVIARTTGFGDPERMRRAFIRSFGQPPQALRRMAQQS